MLKKLVIAVVLISFSVNSQTSIKGTMNPANDYNWVVLYQLKGAKQLYIVNDTVVNGEFSIHIPQNSSKGMYRILYDMQNRGFVDFIYDNENVSLKFDPANPIETTVFLNSEENEMYHNYLVASSAVQQKLDSLQLLFFKLKDEKDIENANKLYDKINSQKNAIQTQFEVNTEGKLANHFIKLGSKYNASELIKTPQEYLNSEKKHYFDFINFEDKELLNSIFLSEKVIDYVFYLSSSEDIDVQNALYKNAVNEIMWKIGINNYLKSELLTTLLYTFAQIENISLIDFIINDFYSKLPEEYINHEVIKDIQSKVKLAVGKMAPEITWEENGVQKKLTAINVAEKYIVVFWSTGCSHCLNEIPKLYEFTKDKSAVHIIAFAMENNAVEFNKYAAKYVKWSNVLGLGKWENSIAKEYQITSTPTYFILDANKKIIAKPENLEDVKAFFEH